jgi:DNA-binding transcriptional MerR regulator
MSLQATRKRVADSTTIPDRLYFKIGDVGRICGLETYVLRFWESQFPQLKPNKSGTGQRLYRRRDVEMVLEIKRLVHEEGYTLPGARQALEMAPKRPALAREGQAKLPVVGGELNHKGQNKKEHGRIGQGNVEHGNGEQGRGEQGNVEQGRGEQGRGEQGRGDSGADYLDGRMDSVAAAIGHARAELRELVGLLATPAVQPPRRRSRLANIAASSGSLFPS